LRHELAGEARSVLNDDRVDAVPLDPIKQRRETPTHLDGIGTADAGIGELADQGKPCPLGRVNAAGTHLLGLINEVLDLSKTEAGKLELNPEPVDLVRLIDEVIGTAGQLAEKNQNRLIVEAQENLGALTADSMRLKQILLNLLSNACKFTKEGEVALRVCKVVDGREWVELAVADIQADFPLAGSFL
jgi:adenylate cyclase